MRTRAVLSGLIFGGLVVAGCDCGDGSELQRVIPQMEIDTATIDFGEVALLASKHASVTITNVGGSSLHITGLDTDAPFSAKAAQTEIPPGGRTSLDLTFTPTTADEQARGRLTVASDADNLPVAQIDLIGQGVAGFVQIIPSEIRFEPTTVGTARSVELVVANRGLEAASGDLVPEGFPRPEQFGMTGLRDFLTPAPLSVAARSQVSLTVEYRPLEAAIDDGVVRFEVCGPRCGYEIKIHGEAIGSILSLEPALLDFGNAPIGQTTSKEIVLKNDGESPVEIRTLSVVGSSEFSATPATAVPVQLAGGARLQVAVDFLPRQSAVASAQLVVTTSDPAVPELRASIEGIGQGPLFLVQPNTIDFGILVDTRPSRRALLLLNAGSSEVRVLGVSISGDREFTMVDIPGLPAPLRSGESVGPAVEFTPSTEREYHATVTIETDDPANTQVEIPVVGAYAEEACQMELQPLRVSFGLLPLGHEQTRSVRLRNVGTNPCNLLSGQFQAPADPFFTTTAAFPLSIPPGNETRFDFAYKPLEKRDAKGNFVVTTDDTVLPHRIISLVGTSNGYDDLLVLPERVDFGSMRPGCTALQREVTVFNVGTDRVTLDSIALTSSSADIRRPVIATPLSISPGSSVGIQLGYSATDIGRDLGELEIAAHDRVFPITVPVSGEGSLTPRQREQFTQSAVRKADILFVIDDSCSMYGEQDNLARNFSSFISTAAIRNIDFQIGITTTDATGGFGPPPRRGGELVGPILKPSTPDLEREFRAQAAVGISGSPNEQGLETMLLAFQLAEAGFGRNLGLFRPDAARVVVIVSDEDDQSAADPVVYFNELRRRVTYYVVAGVTGEATGCINSATGDGAFAAPRYMNFFALTSAISESICGDWLTALRNIGNAAFGLRTRFKLGRPADQTDPIGVTVNGVPNAAWRYDPTDPTIEFTIPPPEGAVIEVEYTPGC
ncbi:MAG: choice-of-anchor D domain-containing protein [Deltaproteobacteria bacterium]|nr:choice-of-anchor D domain-containing protein [Deltaproteobacteria bacterium]